jgi:hypothetical protein
MALDLLSVHVSGAHWPDEETPIALPDGEDDEYRPSESGAANGSEPLFGLGVALIGQHVDPTFAQVYAPWVVGRHEPSDDLVENSIRRAVFAWTGRPRRHG